MIAYPLTLHAARLIGGVVGDARPGLGFDLSQFGGGLSGAAAKAALWSRFLQRSGLRLIDLDDRPALLRPLHHQRPLDATLYTAVPVPPGTDLRGAITSPPGADEVSPLALCFLAGTRIATPEGERAVEDLRPGDRVCTLRGDTAPLVWTSISDVSPEDLDRAPNRRPIVIRANALSPGLPRRDVQVSAQHRVVVTDPDGFEFLASARHLMMAGMPGVEAWRDQSGFQLVHVACARHRILLAEGAPMESFFPGPEAIRALPMAKRLSLFSCFPSLLRGINPMEPARPFIRHRDVAAILRRRTLLARAAG